MISNTCPTNVSKAMSETSHVFWMLAAIPAAERAGQDAQ